MLAVGLHPMSSNTCAPRMKRPWVYLVIRRPMPFPFQRFVEKRAPSTLRLRQASRKSRISLRMNPACLGLCWVNERSDAHKIVVATSTRIVGAMLLGPTNDPEIGAMASGCLCTATAM